MEFDPFVSKIFRAELSHICVSARVVSRTRLSPTASWPTQTSRAV